MSVQSGDNVNVSITAEDLGLDKKFNAAADSVEKFSEKAKASAGKAKAALTSMVPGDLGLSVFEPQATRTEATLRRLTTVGDEAKTHFEAMTASIAGGRFDSAAASATGLARSLIMVNATASGVVLALTAAAYGVSHFVRELLAIEDTNQKIRASAALMGASFAPSIKETGEAVHNLERGFGLAADTANAVVGAIGEITNAAPGTRRRLEEIATTIAAMKQQDPAEVAKQLAEAFKGGATGLQEFAQRYNLLNTETAREMETAKAVNNTFAAQDIVVRALTERLKEHEQWVRNTGGAYAELLKRMGAVTNDQIGGSLIRSLFQRVAPTLPKPVEGPPADEKDRMAALSGINALLAQREAVVRRLQTLENAYATAAEVEDKRRISLGLELARQEKEKLDLQLRQGSVFGLQKSISDAQDRAGANKAQAVREEIRLIQEALRVEVFSAARREELQKRLNALKIDAARSAVGEVSALERLELEQAKKNLEERVAIAREYYNRMRAMSGENSRQAIDALRTLVQVEREYTEQQKQLGQINAEIKRDAALTDLQSEEQLIAQKRSMGLLSSQQEAQRLLELNQRKTQIEIDYLMNVRQLYQEDAVRQRQIDQQILRTRQQARLREEQIQRGAAQDYVQIWQGAMGAFESGVGGVINAIFTRTQTVGQALGNMMMSIATSVIGGLIKMGVQWLITQIGIEEILGLTSKVTAAAKIGNEAAVAGAAAYASTAAIPIVGPFLAPAAAQTAYMGALSYMGALVLPSAEGGWDVPRDSLAQIHEREMVLPQEYADVIRSMGDRGARARQGNQINISAVDARSVLRLFRQHGSALADSLRRQRRNFNSAMMRP